jgi:hypothetical protein
MTNNKNNNNNGEFTKPVLMAKSSLIAISEFG